LLFALLLEQRVAHADVTDDVIGTSSASSAAAGDAGT